MRRLPNINYNLAPLIVERVPWFREHILDWFRLWGRSFPWRERGRTPYEILVAEILLQRTTAAKVAVTYKAFLQSYPSWQLLARANYEDLQSLLRPLGLWQQKAEVLLSLARAIQERGGSLPRSRVELEHLPGIGQYIANAVLVTVHGEAEPLIDVNMARVLERFFGPRQLADIRHDPYLQTLARKVILGTNALEPV